MTAAAAKSVRGVPFAVLVGLLAGIAMWLLIGPAQAQPAEGHAPTEVPSVVYVPPAPTFAPPPAVDFQGLGLAVALVTGIVLFGRAGLRRVLNPEPTTELSKALNMLLAAGAGLAVGWSGLAGGHAVSERLAFGFVAATIATFGRDVFVRGWRSTQGGES